MPYLAGRDVKSVFFGGGTPSILSPSVVGQVLDGIAERLPVCSGAEISLEANPNTFEREKFLAFRKAGINRLSLGVQALNAADLKFWGGRIHLRRRCRRWNWGWQRFRNFRLT